MAGPLLPDDFKGTVRLFPLPDLVLFPQVVQPLRLFEPRYVQLLEDALQDDQLITMALLKPGWESNKDAFPPIYPTVCVGRIVHHRGQTDRTYQILLAGAARAEVVEETQSSLPYRMAHVDLIPDSDTTSEPVDAPELRSALISAVEKSESPHIDLMANFRQLLDQQVSLGMLTDVLAFSLELPIEIKQDLLETADVTLRARQLLRHVQSASIEPRRPQTYPLPFSDN